MEVVVSLSLETNESFSVFAVRQLHREFLRAGADVMQTFTFYASEDKLENRGHTAGNIGVMLVSFAAVFGDVTQRCARCTQIV